MAQALPYMSRVKFSRVARSADEMSSDALERDIKAFTAS